MSRYADQLPINTAPNSANFLLATNDSDGKALERIPLELVGGGGAKEYTILDQTALDVDSNFVLSAGLYLYVGNAPANFDLSGLADGERIEVINHTAHKIYLFGFTNWVWNGTTTPLQTDQGLIVEKGGLIAAKHSGNLLLFNTLPNGLGQNWREGLAPPGFNFWRIDFNQYLAEIQFYYEDNPNVAITLNGGNVISFARSSTYSTGGLVFNFAVLNNGIYTDDYTGSGSTYNAYIVQLPTPKNVVAVHVSVNIRSGPTNIRLYKGNTSIDWILHKEWTGSPLVNANQNIKLNI